VPDGLLVRALLGLVAVPFLLGAAAAPSSQEDVVFSFQDKEITESSGLVALTGGLFVTTNDSGDSARVFTVDEHGRTVGVTTWPGDAHDVEALAPAGGGEVWVGDIGDNRASRDTVQVTQVPVGRGDRRADGPVYELAYPDGAHDAETLLAAPDGRLYVVTKGVLGGAVYAAPATLSDDHVNRLTRVAGGILPMATDGTFLPDGRHVLVRGYVSAAVYEFPGFARVTGVPLPNQPQGEGLAVADDGSIYLSSEGMHSDVLRLPVSGLCTAVSGICARDRGASTAPAPPAATAPSATEQAPADRHTHRGWWPWLLGVAVVGVVGWLQLRVMRSR
jgi:hypothetical protein